MLGHWLLVSLCWASSLAVDVCDFGQPSFLKPKFLNLDDVKKCLDETTMTAEVLYHTVAHVEHGVLDLYSFDSIAAASRESEQSISNGCNFAVHDVHVDLRKELDELKVRALKELGLQGEQFEELLQAENRGRLLHAYPIHSTIADIFRRLYDAHTIYVPPWVPNFIAWYMYHFQDAGQVSGQTRIRLKVTGDGAKPEVQILDNQGVPGDYVEEVKDGDKAYAPFDWIKQDAARHVGLYKSLGARVNSRLNEWGIGVFGLSHSPLPESGSLSFKVRDRDTGKIQIKSVGVHLQQKSPTTLQSLNMSINRNARWDLVKGWLQVHVHSDARERQQRMQTLKALALQLAETPQEQANCNVLPWQQPVIDQGVDQPDRLEPLVTERRLQNSGEPELIATYPDQLTGHAPEIFVYYLQKHSTAVLRVTSFMPPAKDAQDPLAYIAAIVLMYKKAVDTGAGRLILDLTDNGGGMVEAANMLIQLIAPRLNTRDKLCNPYAARLESFWRDWLDSFGGKWDEIARAASNKSPEDLVEKLSQLVNLVHLARGLHTKLPLDEQKLLKLAQDVNNAAEGAEKKQLIIDHLISRDILLNSMLLGKDADSGWFPFTGDVRDMEGNPFQPQTKPYFTSVKHKWGPRTSNYSDKFQFACELGFSSLIDALLWFKGSSLTGAKHQWKELAVLTNGLCGSACSMTATKLQMAEGATVFTFGGVPGEQMDVSAFAGGNVEQYKEFWPTVLHAALIGDILHGPETRMHQRLQESVKAGDFASTLLLPLPTPAIMTFNFNMIFEPTLGDKALPREFYLMPAHKNYDRWLVTATDPFSQLSQRTTAQELLDLFTVIAAEDWKAVRQGAGGFDGCGDSPPTTPYRGQWDWGVIVYPLLTLLLCLCCSCCRCCYVCCCGKRKDRSAAVVGPPVEPGVQLQAFPAQA
eukprot:TRINITY_DN6032_c1_g1_i1.p1 TRINITY_DN6032_c1_g1~~TRINITY_DN6032_c1_g1_i1.p1  ORF type:complete len:923 (-),score=142.37 TRINITY_DN6032_c1_g1_i1:265-3033(-)